MKKVLMLMLVAGSLFAKCELVVVSATWCPACKVQGKILKDKKLTKFITDNNVTVTKYDVDKDNVPKKFNKGVIPYTFVVNDGEVFVSGRGIYSAEAIQEAIIRVSKDVKKSEGTN